MAAAETADRPANGRRALAVSSGAHVLHDGYTDLLYVMLPIWQAEFALGYAAVATLRALYNGSMACLQVPSSHLADRFGHGGVLAAGTLLAGLGFALAGASADLYWLAAALVLCGIGASVQHPIASGIVARAYAGTRSRAALGAYNFAGDIGKVALPAATALLVTLITWRPALWIMAALGVATAVAILALTPRHGIAVPYAAAAGAPAQSPARHERRRGFRLLFSIGVIDSATRGGFLTFLPFLLIGKGATLATVGLALALTFAGGAAGKLVCAWLGARLGVLGTVLLTEGMTAMGILVLLPLPLEAALVLLPVIGVALNGTSSVLYGTVPELVPSAAQTKAFGVFYTGTIGAGATAPILYGFLSDAFGITATIPVVAGIVLLTLPLAVLLNRELRASAQ